VFAGLSEGDWAEGELSFASTDLPPLDPTVVAVLNENYGALLTSSAINTVSQYMLEFGDQINNKWMTGFRNFKEAGFEEQDWHTYLEDMIHLPEQQIKVYIAPSRMAHRHETTAEENNMRGMYMADVSPRKIAHRIVSVRENLCEEIIEDLGSVRIANQQAITYAKALISGREEKGLLPISAGMGSAGGSTPLRHKTFTYVVLLVTNLALDLVKAQLQADGDVGALELVDCVLGKVEGELQAMSPMERQLAEPTAPQRFLEELCYVGLTEGVKSTQEKYGLGQQEQGVQRQQSNYLKVAQMVLDFRLSVATTSIRVLEAQLRENRQYYTLIKECGGVLSFQGKRLKPVLSVVNIVEEERKDAAEAMAAKARQRDAGVKQRAAAEAVRVAQREVEGVEKAVREEARRGRAALATGEEEGSIFGERGNGPTMM
jgi:hypothetical protein